ncbi:hypothetical protein F4604DRAFT_1920220 [Suillus subluteus]|nr:hypothetical protein F4604DRAFT_1920220 [Suillus subluteus]
MSQASIIYLMTAAVDLCFATTPPDLSGKDPSVWSEPRVALTTIGHSEDSSSWLLGKTTHGGDTQAFATMITTDWLFEIDVPSHLFHCQLSPGTSQHFQFHFHDEAALWRFTYYVSSLRTPLVSKDLPQMIRSSRALASDYFNHILPYSPTNHFPGHASCANNNSDPDDSDTESIDSDASFSDSTTSQSELGSDHDCDYDWVSVDEVGV